MTRAWCGVVWAGVLLAGGALAEERWETAVSGPITVRMRAVPGSPAKEVWAEGLLQAEAVDLQAALTDTERLPAFMPFLKEARRLGPPQGRVERVYNLTEPPLVGKRDYVLEVTLLQSVEADGTGRFHQRWRALPEALPVQPGVTRLKFNEGSWLITPRPGGTSHVVYRFRVDPGGWVPGFLADLASSKGVPDTLKALEKEARRRGAARQGTTAAHAPRPPAGAAP